MKQLTFYISLIVALLCSVQLFAHERETISAEWEQKAQAELWSDRIVAQTPGADNFRIHADCPADLIVTIRSMRKALALVIAQTPSRTARELLTSLAQFDAVDLTATEDILLSQYVADSDLHWPLNVGRQAHPDHDVSITMSTAALASSSNTRSHKKHISPYRAQFTMMLNLPKQSCSNKFTDIVINYFQLFLYIWEDNPKTKLIRPIIGRMVSFPPSGVYYLYNFNTIQITHIPHHHSKGYSHDC